MEIYKKIVKKIKRMKNILYGSNYVYETKQILKKIGDQPITKIEIGKSPIPSYIIDTFNKISLGEIKKNIPYQLYHVFLKITIDNKEYVLEKNEFIKLQKWRYRKNTEYKELPLHKPTTLHKILHKVKSKMKHNFFRFNFKTNNCQDFTIHILQSLHLYYPGIQSFVKQDIRNIYNNMYITPIIAEIIIVLKLILHVILYI